jgi:hypothetical protein
MCGFIVALYILWGVEVNFVLHGANRKGVSMVDVRERYFEFGRVYTG